MNTYKVLGLMSGTSLDGLDLAFCEFEEGKEWKFKIVEAETINYSEHFIQLLLASEKATAIEYFYNEVEYSRFTAQCCTSFIRKHGLVPDLISAHGHTIFHQPKKGITKQMLDGSIVAATTNITTVCGFRNNDVALGGQGAPLVPIGDALLMGNYDCCLNLGGIANISYQEKNKRLAFDVCPANMGLNYLASKVELEYDKDGALAKSGKIDETLLKDLNSLLFYQTAPPKSLGKEWFVEYFKPMIDSEKIKLVDIMCTVVEHIAVQIAKVSTKNKSMLVTGGGAFNGYLMGRIKANTNTEIILPDKRLINFKEAMIFAFLGLLKFKGQINSLSSVTGAKKDSSGGVIYFN